MDYLTALKLANLGEDDVLTPASLHVASRWDPQVLRTCLVAHARLQSRALQVSMGNFGDLFLQLENLRQAGGSDPLLILLDEEDFLPGSSLRSDAHLTRPLIEQALNEAGTGLERFASILRDLAPQHPILLLPPSLPAFPLLPSPEGSFSPAGRLRHQISLALFDLQSSFPRQIHILDPQALGGNLPPDQWKDDRLLFAGGWPFGKGFTDRMAETCVLLLFPCDEPRKILITDADGTLWRGIVGDDGAEALSWAQEPETYRHLLYQKTLNLLISEGILVAISSKNSPENLASALRRKDFVLESGKLSAMEASWEPKSAMIQRILASTNLLPSAAVFVDDSDFELGEVTQTIPGVTCLRFPGDNLGLRAFLQKLRGLFNTRILSKEDAGRVESMRNTQQFQQELKIAGGTEGYLATLQMQACVEPIAPNAADRAFQLLNKTNQFNLCGRRWDAAEWDSRIRSREHISLQLSFRDRNCDYGIISVLLADRRGLVTDWVLSCRVFSRTIEHYFLNHLLFELKASGVKELRLGYKETGKNHAMRSFLGETAVADDMEQVWRFTGHTYKIPLIVPFRTESPKP